MAEATEGRGGGGGGEGGGREGRGTNREGRCSEGDGFSRSIKLPQTMDIALRNIKDAKVYNCYPKKYNDLSFLAVHNSSIGDLVTD